jgi:2'-5' RNA ligase
MTEKLFVGLTFRTDNTLSRKIDSFRSRFDPKYKTHSFPHMSLLAPFEINPENLNHLKEELVEELDSFFFDMEDSLKLGFTGVEILQTKKNNLLYLNPNFDPTLVHCMELVKDICQSFIPRHIKYSPNPKQFLPLGSFDSGHSIEAVLDTIKDEFSINSELTVTGLSLYRKRYGVWMVEENLISFRSTKDRFLQL